MAGKIPSSFIDQLLSRIDIVDVVGSRVPLKKAGKDFHARCPFHDEKTPSFTVSQDKQFYHCFGCGAHGSAIGFLMEYDHMAFPEAVEDLAHQAGLEVPREASAAHGGPDLAPFYATLERAGLFFRAQLQKHRQAGRAVDYLKQRGLSGDIAAAYGLGYAPPGWDNLAASLGTDQASLSLLEETGLLAGHNGRLYDRFRDRVMFPIRDPRGRTIGFGGRLLGAGKPKYLNSPETPVFHKGRELYGLHEARQALRRLDHLLVVEGYLDVIALAQFGIHYAVATLGTAATEEHIERLFRSAPSVIFCFDGDPAGRRAAWKALHTALPQMRDGREARFLFLPESEDPDSLVRKEGKESFEQRIRQASPLSEFLFDQLSQQLDLAHLDGRARLAELAKPVLSKLPPGLFHDMMLQRLAELVAVRAELLTDRADRPAASAPGKRRAHLPGVPQRMTPVRLAISLLVQDPRLAQHCADLDESWRGLDAPGIDLLAGVLELIRADPNLTTATLIERWRGDAAEHHLSKLATLDLGIPQEGLADELKGALNQLTKQFREQELERLYRRLSLSDLSGEEKQRLRQLFAEQSKEQAPRR